VHADLDTLATALYVRIDDELKASPQLNRWRPKIGIAPQITDAELITVSVMQALLGYRNESRWIRYAPKSIIHLFPPPARTARLQQAAAESDVVTFRLCRCLSCVNAGLSRCRGIRAATSCGRS
jgi:hypothetical protein